jgi:DNA-directed RNA polymerase specialized sigma24 family protein
MTIHRIAMPVITNVLIRIARSTMCDWMRQSAEALEPLYETMVKDTLASRVIHTDDTSVEVQEPSPSYVNALWRKKCGLR